MVRYSNITRDELETLQEKIASDATFLNLARCKLTLKSLPPLINILQTSTKLRNLNLNFNQYLGGTGVQKILDVLETKTKLVELNLSWTSYITNHEGKDIGKFLRHNSTLKTLVIKNIFLGYSTGFEDIAEALYVNSSLKRLFISSNLGRYACVTLMETLKVNTTLRVLDIGDNRINRDILTRIVSILPHTRGLRQLKLSQRQPHKDLMKIIDEFNEIKKHNRRQQKERLFCKIFRQFRRDIMV